MAKVSKYRNGLANLSLIFFSIIFSLIVGEIALKIIKHPPLLRSGWKYEGTRFERNELRFRGQLIEYEDDDFVIVLLGDSQVEALACAYKWMPERRLQHHLNSLGKKVKVFSVGTGGYGQDQQLLALEEYYQQYRADLVLLWQTPPNDIWNNMFPTHWPKNGTLKPTFWLENGELQGPSETIIREVIPSSRLVLLWRNIFKSPLKRDDEWEKYLPEPYTPITNLDGLEVSEWEGIWNGRVIYLENENLDTEKSHLAIKLAPRSKRMEYGIELSRRLLQEIEKLVVSNEGELVVFRVNKDLVDEGPDEVIYQLKDKYYKFSKEQGEQNMNDINEGFTQFVIPIKIKDYAVGPQDIHLNQHAVDELMKDLAIEVNDFIPNPGSGTEESKTLAPAS